MMKYLKRLAAHILHILEREPLILAGMLLFAGILSSLGELTEEVLEGESHAIDHSLLLALRTPGEPDNPLGPLWLEEMMRDFTALGGVAILTLVTAAAALYLLVRRQQGTALYLIAAVITGSILSNLLKMGFDRPRPDLVPHGSYTYTASFPSGHALLSAVVYLTLGSLLAQTHKQYRLKLYFLGLAVGVTFLVGVSRVYLGVHWPSDVLAGWLGGTAWALMFWITARYLRVRNIIHDPPPE